MKSTRSMLLAAGFLGLLGFLAGSPARTLGAQEGAQAPEDPRLVKMTGFYSAIGKSLYREQKQAGSLTISLTVCPDAYRVQVIEGFMKLLGEGAKGEDLWVKMRAVHRKAKPHRDKISVQVTLTGTSSGTAYYFIPQALKNVMAIRSKSLKTSAVLGTEPALRFENWTVLDASSLQTKLSLAMFQTLRVDMLATLKDRKDPLRLATAGIASQTKKADRNDSLSVEARQISCRGWSGLLVPEAVFTIPQEKLMPVDPPPGFEELMAEIAAEEPGKKAKKR